MTQENLPDETNANVRENQAPTHKKRRKPRRNGGRSNTNLTGVNKPEDDDLVDNTNTDVSDDNQKNPTLSTDLVSGDVTTTDTSTAEEKAAEEAALSEGGIKTIGNQKIVNFMKIEKPMAIISGLMVIISIIALAVNNLNLGLDFTGGISADVSYEQPVEQVAVTQTLADNGFDDAVVQYLGTRQELLVRLPPQDTKNSQLSDNLTAALQFDGNKATVANTNIIGSQVGNEVYLNSMMAMALALSCMLMYVALRFQFKLSVGAVVALFHDTIVTLGVFAIMGWPFDLTVLAAILALIGYSLNDTIVVYDRIRENFRRIRGLNPREVVNVSLTETLRRTFMTSMTVLLVVWAMMILGGDGLYWFALTLFIGMVAGTYSSVYIASAIPLMMGMSRDDFVVIVKPEFEEEVVSFDDRNAAMYDDDEDYYDDEFEDVTFVEAKKIGSNNSENKS